MFHQFSHRHTPCTVDGAMDKVIFSRDRNSTVTQRESMYIGRFAPTSAVQNGSLIVSTDSFLVQTLRITPDMDKFCSLVKTNAVIDVKRYGKPTVGDPDFLPIISGVKAYAEFVTADLRQQHIGLLPSTKYVLIAQRTVDVKNPDHPLLYKPDRIVLHGRNYQVEVVDDVKLPNLYHIQLSEDFR